jgi:hypothetical protein
MSDVNPYASPATPTDPVPAEVVDRPRYRGLFRQGNLLVMHRKAVLPDVCVKSNQPARGRRLRRSLYWHFPILYVTILTVGPLIYFGLVVALNKHAVVEIGLSEEWFRRRREARTIGWLWFLGGIAMLITSFFYLDGRFPFVTYKTLVALLVTVGGAAYGWTATRIVAAERITNYYVWLKGVSPEFLATLPPWPGPP